jgi:putative peptidoglycan lipid II flippase
MSLTRNISIIGLITAGGRLLGYVRDFVLVYMLGASGLADSLFLASKIGSLFRRLFTEGGFNASFIPIFNDLRIHEGMGSSRRFTEQSMVWMACIMGVVTLLVMWKTEAFVRLTAPGFSPESERYLWTVQLTRIIFPYVWIICITALLGSMLNALHHFYHTTASLALSNLTIIILIYAFKDLFPTVAHGAGYAILISACIQFIWLYLVAWKKENILLIISLPKITPAIKQFFIRIAPGIFGTGMSQINVVLSIYFGSYLENGGVVYLQITERIKQFPLSIIGVALGTVLIPLLSEKLQKNDLQGALETQNEAIKIALRLSLPITIFLVAFASPSVATLFLYGEFTPQNVIDTAACLQVMVLGLPAYILVKIFSSTFFALKDTLRPSIAGLVSMITNGLICYYVIHHYQGERMCGVVGVAAALAISGWINLVVLFLWLIYKKYFALNSHWKSILFYESTAFAAFTLIIYLLYISTDIATLENTLNYRLCLAKNVLLSLGAYYAIHFVLRKIWKSKKCNA